MTEGKKQESGGTAGRRTRGVSRSAENGRIFFGRPLTLELLNALEGVEESGKESDSELRAVKAISKKD